MKYNTAWPYFFPEDIEEILAKFRGILEGKAMLTMGENVRAFEQEFAAYVGTDHGVAANSCTSALEIVLRALDIGQGDEVIVPAQTFIANGACVSVTGARPVFAETGDDFLIDLDDLKRRVTGRTKAVIIVHFAGLVHPRIHEIKTYLNAKGIKLIEDAAHAHGASLGGVRAGNLADAACFSFFSTKIMTTGEGGMVVTSDRRLAERCASLRDRGVDVHAPVQIFVEPGGNRRMTEFQAILGRCQLKRLDAFSARRNRVASIYRDILAPLVSSGVLAIPGPREGDVHAYWRFVIQLKGTAVTREQIKEKLGAAGIAVDWPYDPLLPLQPAFVNACGMKAGDFPRTEALARRHFCLPMHYCISDEDARFIAQALVKIL